MKAIITSAGLGTRMKHVTSIIPKALLPLFKKEGNSIVTEPMIDLIMDYLEAVNIQDFCIVVGAHGRVLLEHLYDRGATFVVQKEPKGFGDAVLRAERFANSSPVFVHADDGLLVGGYSAGVKLFENKNADGVVFVRRVPNPSRYGIATLKPLGTFMDHAYYEVTNAEEKPKEPKSDYALIAAYVFSSKIFEALKSVSIVSGELELTYGIQKLIEGDGKVYAIEIGKNEKWLNVGDPASYLDSLQYSYANL